MNSFPMATTVVAALALALDPSDFFDCWLAQLPLWWLPVATKFWCALLHSTTSGAGSS